MRGCGIRIRRRRIGRRGGSELEVARLVGVRTDRVHEGADRRIDRFQEGIHDVWNAVSIRLILRCRNRRGGTLGSGEGSVFVSVTGSFSFG